MSEDEDLDLKLKLHRMQRRLLAEKAQRDANPSSPPLKDPEAVVRSKLRERGVEVLDAAMQQFPVETKQVVEELAGLIKKGEISEITGPWLYSVLNQIGLPVRLRTTIQIVSDGKVGSIADKLKER